MRQYFKTNVRRIRWWFLLPIPVLVIIINAFGPDGWREPAARLLWISWAAIALALSHLARRVLHDYVDAEKAWLKSLEHPVGAGLSFIGICILGAVLFFGLVSLAKGAPDTPPEYWYIPEQAKSLLPELKKTQKETWEVFQFPSYFGSLIEHESCISLNHSRCWNTAAQLKTSREEGAGLGQFTRAWDAQGRLRFDALAEVRALDPVGLAGFTWQTVYDRADLNMRAIIIKFKDCATRFARQAPQVNSFNSMAFCDAAYNGGYGGMLSDRQLCNLVSECDPNRWFGHVEHHSNKNRQRWQGYGKSAYQINREHVTYAVYIRRLKYRPYLGKDA